MKELLLEIWAGLGIISAIVAHHLLSIKEKTRKHRRTHKRSEKMYKIIREKIASIMSCTDPLFALDEEKIEEWRAYRVKNGFTTWELVWLPVTFVFVLALLLTSAILFQVLMASKKRWK